jgi:hypothetical protein
VPGALRTAQDADAAAFAPIVIAFR